MVWRLTVRILQLYAPVILVLSWTGLSFCSETDPGGLLHPLNVHSQETHRDDLRGILKRKHIRVLTTFNQTNFFIANTGFYGFEYSLLKDYERYINKPIGRRDLRVTMEFVPVRRNELIPSLLQGRGDIAAAGLTITPERERKVTFTRPYLTGINELVVSYKGVRGLSSLRDLAGKRIYVRRSSSYYESLKRLNRSLRENGLRPVKIFNADESLETEDILEMVNSGAIKLTVADHHIASIWASVLKNIQVNEKLALRKRGQIAWAIRKNNPELKKSVNSFLKTHRKGSLLGNIYFNRYFKKNRWMKNPLSAKAARRDMLLKRLFKKYAKRYSFDWKLIMAVAFQESKLNHKLRSPAGAVGIMQIKPATARDKSVGINNVNNLENNIHAGVKYLAHLRNHYFSDSDIKERDRVRLSLAAYNAGPTKIQRIRSKTKRMGLNPDRWFRNVELVALRHIGQEPVRYVSNINKYYILFNMADDNRALRAGRKKKTK